MLNTCSVLEFLKKKHDVVSSRSDSIAKNLLPGMHCVYKAYVALRHTLFDITDTHELHDSSLLLPRSAFCLFSHKIYSTSKALNFL